MANKVLSMEIGRTMTRVVEMDDQAKKPRIYGAFTFDTPASMWDDGAVSDSQVFVAKFKQECEAAGIEANRVIFTVFSSRIASREVTIPVVKENKIASLIDANAAEYFPVELSEYKLVHTVIDKIDTPETKQYKINVMAIPIDLIKSYMSVAKACRLTVEGFDYVGNSVAQLARKHFSEGGLNVLFKVEFDHTLITVMNGTRVDLQRAVPYGIIDAVDVMMESKAYGDIADYMHACDIFSRKTCIRRHFDDGSEYRDEEDTNPDIISAKAEITEALRPLVSNLGRNLNYYISNHKDAKIDQINLIGIGSEFSGLSKLLTNELNQKITVLKAMDESKLSKEMETAGFSLNRYFANVGATVHPVILKNELGDLEGGTAAEGKESLKLAVIVFAACIAAALFMVVFSVVSGMVLKNTNNALTEEKNSLQSALDTYNSYKAVQSKDAELKKLYASTDSPNEQLASFLTEMEAKMPSSINVVTFSADTESVSMTVKVADKAAAAAVLVQLRTFSSLSDVTTAGITEMTDETGASSVSMSVICTYAPVSTSDTASN